MTSTTEKYLTPITPDQVKLEIKDPVDPTALSQAKEIISELQSASSSVLPSNLMNVAHRLNDIPKESTKYIVTKEECKAAYDNLDETERKSLDNIYARVKAFAEAQRKSVVDMEIDIPGGKAGHTVSPCKGECQTYNLFYAYLCNVLWLWIKSLQTISAIFLCAWFQSIYFIPTTYLITSFLTHIFVIITYILTFIHSSI